MVTWFKLWHWPKYLIYDGMSHLYFVFFVWPFLIPVELNYRRSTCNHYIDVGSVFHLSRVYQIKRIDLELIFQFRILSCIDCKPVCRSELMELLFKIYSIFTVGFVKFQVIFLLQSVLKFSKNNSRPVNYIIQLFMRTDLTNYLMSTYYDSQDKT